MLGQGNVKANRTILSQNCKNDESAKGAEQHSLHSLCVAIRSLGPGRLSGRSLHALVTLHLWPIASTSPTISAIQRSNHIPKSYWRIVVQTKAKDPNHTSIENEAKHPTALLGPRGNVIMRNLVSKCSGLQD